LNKFYELCGGFGFFLYLCSGKWKEPNDYCKIDIMRNTLNILFSLVLCALITACSGDVATYYVDATLGDDANDGLSPATAWRSLERASQLVLTPGEQLLLKRGETYEGQLIVTGHGTADSLVLVGAYGEGAMPVVTAPDSSLFAVKITNSDYLTLRGLEIVNHGSEDLPRRTGLHIEVLNYGTSRYVTVDSLYIHDVNGSLVKQLGGGSGIYVSYRAPYRPRTEGAEAETETIPSNFDHLTIQNCHIVRCQRNAMIWQEEANRDHWNPSLHTLVCGNLIEQVPGDGIVPIWCDSCVIEYNVMCDCPELLPDTEAAAGFWPWSCDNTVIRYNEVSDHKAPWDAQAYDCDYNCRNTLIEYNYSHDNYGGLVLVCTCAKQAPYNIGNQRPVVRYNLSINDGLRPQPRRGGMFSPSIHVAGPSDGALISHNIIHQNVKPQADIDTRMVCSDSWEGCSDSACYEGNIFYSANASGFDMNQSTNNQWKGNYYLGNTVPNADTPDDQAAVAEWYQQEVLAKGADGFAGLTELLLEEREVWGRIAHFVSKEKMGRTLPLPTL